jgi:DNA polymerase elongation subunit (family B)
MKDIAASTTATGRQLLYLAKEKVEEKFAGSKIVYGDTDSIFIDFNPTEDGREGLKQSIQMGLEAEEYIQQFLKPPHKLEYEKTFWPFILFSKKRYIGNKYEFKTGENDYKETSMGIVLKRRDNADIVKHAYGGVIDILMNQKNVELSITYLKGELQKLLDGRFPMEMLIITKSLRGFYKNPQQIAHKVLADRIGVRDPGNKPKSNDRIPYVYIETKEKHKLQGDRIETPEYIKEQDLKPDYMFYITNQIMKPVAQIYSLIVENLDGFKYKPDYYKTKYRSLLGSKTPEKAREKIQNMRFDDTCDIVFGDIIRIAENRKNKATTITDFFNVVKKSK